MIFYTRLSMRFSCCINKCLYLKKSRVAWARFFLTYLTYDLLLTYGLFFLENSITLLEIPVAQAKEHDEDIYYGGS